MSSTRSDRAREIASLNRLHDRHVDGLILMTNTPDDGTLAALIGRRRNVVLIDEDIPGVKVPRVFVENVKGAHVATRHLIEAGHRRIAFIGGPVGLFSAEERYAGYLKAMAEASLSVEDDLVRRGSFAPDFSRAATAAFATRKNPPTAIFASSDYIAIGAILGLKQAGVSVPSQMSLVGFDDMPLTELFNPPLTAIRQPIEALGRQGFQALFALLNGQKPKMLTRLPVSLIERESVTSPRKGGLKS
jgi:LacI family transcriptional regulator